MVTIMKGYEALKNKTPHQNQDVEGSYSENNFAGHLKQTDVNLHNVHIMKLFLGCPSTTELAHSGATKSKLINDEVDV